MGTALLETAYFGITILYLIAAVMSMLPIYNSDLIFKSTGATKRIEAWFTFFGIFFMPFLFGFCGIYGYVLMKPFLFLLPILYVIVGVIMLSTCCKW